MSRTYSHSGRTKYDQFYRRYNNRKIRVQSREFYNRVEYDPEAADEKIIKGVAPKWWCYGKLWRPLRRWIASHVGEPWDDVYSELVSKIKRYLSDDCSIRESVR